MLAILYIDLPLDPLCYIIGAIPNGAMEKRKAYLQHILSLVAKTIITLAWLKALPFTPHQWQDRLMKVYSIEKIAAKLYVKTDMFLKRL